MDPTDQELVRRIREGDVGAYAVLVQRHHLRFLRFGMRMLGNRDDAEEAVQDAFVRAYRFLGRYEERNRFDAWAFRILVNQCRTLLAKQRRRERTFVPYELALEESDEPGWSHVWSLEVQRALAELPSELREPLLLKYVEEQSYEEISDLTGLGRSALKMRVKRARERLQERLKELNNV
ncbi:MAG TPA: RNA polymerase sigma factor [Longimicrobiaceae bacterium]|nr:RNA polymerase sigma factor [Longimicrobiaceae bacterium]